MAVTLKKGQRVNLKKEAPNLNRVLVGLGWDPVKEHGFFGRKEADIDIDASVICIDKDNHHVDTIYFGNLRDSSGSIIHAGDNLTGDGDGDDEQIHIILDRLPSYIVRLAIIINIYSAYSRKQDFGKVKNCFVHVMDEDTHTELIRYDIKEDFSGKTGIFVADIYLHNGEWKFQALGNGERVRNISEMVNMKCGR